MSADTSLPQIGRTPLPLVRLSAIPEGLHTASSSAEIQLSIGGRPLRLHVTVPTEPTPLQDLLPVFQGLTNIVVDFAVENVERQGLHVSCQKGCGACCRQRVPITPSEARALARLVERMPEPRRSQVQARFADAVRRLDAAGLLGRLRQPQPITDPGYRALGLDYFRLGIACPFLDEESCSIHPDRPLICREYLVTSPAANCARTTDAPIRCVPLPAEVFQAVRAVEGEATDSSGWLTLPLALEWATAHPEPPPARSGQAWLEDFMGHLTSKPDHPGETVSVAGWIAADNLRPFLTTLGWVIGYKFADAELAAIASEVGKSDSEAGYWSEHDIVGGRQVKFRMARDPSGDVDQVGLEVPREVVPQVNLALTVFQHFHLRERLA